MLNLDFLPSGYRMYASDPASFWKGVDEKGIPNWFDRDKLSVGTEINCNRLYELYNKYNLSDEKHHFTMDRRSYWSSYFDDEPRVFGFIGSSRTKNEPSGHVCSLLWRDWKLRTVTLWENPQDFQFHGKSYLWAPDTVEGHAVLMELKLIFG